MPPLVTSETFHNGGMMVALTWRLTLRLHLATLPTALSNCDRQGTRRKITRGPWTLLLYPLLVMGRSAKCRQKVIIKVIGTFLCMSSFPLQVFHWSQWLGKSRFQDEPRKDPCIVRINHCMHYLEFLKFSFQSVRWFYFSWKNESCCCYNSEKCGRPYSGRKLHYSPYLLSVSILYSNVSPDKSSSEHRMWQDSFLCTSSHSLPSRHPKFLGHFSSNYIISSNIIFYYTPFLRARMSQEDGNLISILTATGH